MKAPYSLSGTTVKNADGTLSVTFSLEDSKKSVLQSGTINFPAGTDAFAVLRRLKHLVECTARANVDASIDLASFSLSLDEFDVLG